MQRQQSRGPPLPPPRVHSRSPHRPHHASSAPQHRPYDRDNALDDAQQTKRGRVEPSRRGGKEPAAPVKTWTSFDGATSPALVTSRISKSPTLESLVHLLASAHNLAQFNAISLSAAVSRLGKLTVDHAAGAPVPSELGSVLDRVVGKIEPILSTLDNRVLVGMLQGVASSGFFVHAATTSPARRLCVILIDELDARRFELLDACKPADVANVLWSLAKLNWDCALFALLCDWVQSAPSLVDYDAAQLSHIAWAVGKSGGPTVNAAEMLDRLAGEYVARGLPRFSLQQLSSMLFALATQRVQGAPFTRALAGHLGAREVDGLDWLDACTTAWGFAALRALNTLDDGDAALLARLAGAIDAKSGELDAQAVGNAAWAMAKLWPVNPRAAEACLAALVRRCLALGADSFAAADLTSVLWALAQAGLGNDEVFRAAAKRLLRGPGVGQLSARELSYVFWAFAANDERCELGLFAALAAEVTKRDLQTFGAQDLANMAWSMATLGLHDNAHAFKRIAAHAAAIPACEFAPTDVANLTWAFACANVLGCDAVGEFLHQHRTSLDAQSAADALQYSQAVAAWALEEAGEPPALLQAAQLCRWAVSPADVYRQVLRPTPLVVHAVARELASLGCGCAVDHVSPQGLVVDILATRPDGRVVAVEVIVNGALPTGMQAFLRRLLAKQYPFACSIAAVDWELAKTPEARRRLLEAVVA